MRSADVLSRVFRADEATEDVVEALFGLRLVCKEWSACIGLVVVDEHWLQPLRESGKRFCAELPWLVDEVTAMPLGVERLQRCGYFEARTREHMYEADTLVAALKAMDRLLEDRDTDQTFVLCCIDIIVKAMCTYIYIYMYATYCNILQHNATYCNILQHTATHCNTLQHTATHFGNSCTQ